MKKIISIFVLALVTLSVFAQQEKEVDFYELASTEAERLERVLALEYWQVFYVDSTLVHDYMAMDAEMKKLQKAKVSNVSIYQSVQDKWMEIIDASYKRIFNEHQWELYLKQGALKAQKQREKRKAKSQKNK